MEAGYKPGAGALEDTGERCLPWMGDTRVVYEHLHRYYFAQTLVTGLDVLDLGCGEGYGAAILADAARKVVAVDIDADSIHHAQERYRRKNLRFEVASAEELEMYSDASFDVVICFEVLEHVHGNEAVVAAVRRVLRPAGLFIVSTPDRERYNASRPPNPFHVHELSAAELGQLLATAFDHQAMWTQHLIVGSALRAAPARSRTFHSVTVERRDGVWEPTLREDDYVLAIASARALHELPALSLLEDRESSIIEDTVRTAIERTETRWFSVAKDLTEQLHAAQSFAEDLTERLHAAQSVAEDLQSRAASAEANLARVTSSRGWRMLEHARRLFRAGRARS